MHSMGDYSKALYVTQISIHFRWETQNIILDTIWVNILELQSILLYNYGKRLFLKFQSIVCDTNPFEISIYFGWDLHYSEYNFGHYMDNYS